ncbi:MAG: hypothetical protein RLZZ565_423, partial [Planctomycetota bacterium]
MNGGKEGMPVSAPPANASPRGHRFVDLEVTSNFTFLTGASHPHELVERAAALGAEAIAITDRASLAGIVRAHQAAKRCGIGLVVGARLGLHLGAGGLQPRDARDRRSGDGGSRE